MSIKSTVKGTYSCNDAPSLYRNSIPLARSYNSLSRDIWEVVAEGVDLSASTGKIHCDEDTVSGPEYVGVMFGVCIRILRSSLVSLLQLVRSVLLVKEGSGAAVDAVDADRVTYTRVGELESVLKF